MVLEINFDSKIWILAICTFPKILSNSKNSQIFEQSFFVEIQKLQKYYYAQKIFLLLQKDVILCVSIYSKVKPFSPFRMF